MNNTDWVLIDVETSGETAGNRVIELGLVEMRGWKPVGRGKSWLINHDCEISWSAQKIHGISSEMLNESGMSPVKAYREFMRFLDGRPYGAHNLSFENRCLSADFSHYGIKRLPKPAICTLRMARMFLGSGGNSLGSLAERYEFRNLPGHRALADARATAELSHRVLSKKVDITDFDFLCRLSGVPIAKARALYDSYTT